MFTESQQTSNLGWKTNGSVMGRKTDEWCMLIQCFLGGTQDWLMNCFSFLQEKLFFTVESITPGILVMYRNRISHDMVEICLSPKSWRNVQWVENQQRSKQHPVTVNSNFFLKGQFTQKWKAVIICSHLCTQTDRWSFWVHKTFL